MCTVTYIPQPDHSFVLTQNRDEHKDRKPSSFPATKTVGQTEVLFPIDGEAGGTWMAVSEQGRAVSLLNGAFELHKRQTPYRKSRGLILMECFEYEHFEEFAETVDLHNIEPFTMVVVEQNETAQLWDFRWDGDQKHLKQLPPNQKYIWSSATLYAAPIRQKREGWFENWKSNRTEFSPTNILEFHMTNSHNDVENDFLMSRTNGVQTVSVTQVNGTKETLCMDHRELRKSTQNALCINLKQSAHA